MTLGPQWLQKYFHGRLRRAEYSQRMAKWLALALASWPALLDLDAQPRFEGAHWVLLTWNLLSLAPTFGLTARRLHDVGWTGWFQLIWIGASLWLGGTAALAWYSGEHVVAWFLASIALAPLLHMVGVLFLYKGDPGLNRFGNP